ncbi:hypothetical protein ACFX12_044568 [Malus domestica]
MADSRVTISDLGNLEGEASKEDGGHRGRTTAERPTIEPQRHQPKTTIWDIIFILSSAFSLLVDPLMCYVVVIVEEDTCHFWDHRLMWTFMALRSIGDLFYAVDIVVYAEASSTKPAYDHHVTTFRNSIHERAVRFLNISLHIWLALPVIQVILITVKYTYRDPTMLILLSPVQYTLRAYNLYEELDRRANVETGIRRLLNALLDFLPFASASYLYGSMWYILAVNRELECWLEYACKHEPILCDTKVFYPYNQCSQSSHKINANLKLSCSVDPLINMNSFPFDYGIYLPALQSNLTSSTDLPRKILHCFWWGLRNLSSFGSNLQTSFYVPEIIFSVMISITGSALFLVYLNSWVNQGFKEKAKQRKLRMRKKTTIPDLKDLIMSYVPMLKKVPILGSSDKKGLKAISEHLKPEIYDRDVYIIREGEPMRKMLFIRQGTALTYTISNGATSVCKCLVRKDFYGEELAIWALKSASFSELPICTSTLVSESEVEAFSITASDLKSAVAKFWWYFIRELPHCRVEYFAASSIQAAWRRHHAKKKPKRSKW